MNSNKKKKILIIEDQLSLCFTLKTIIETIDLNVVVVPNGRLGFEVLKKNNISLIICDINLPDTSGYEIIETLKSTPTYRYIPFVFLTAFADEKDVKFGIELGANAYITKPFSAKDLLGTITSILSKCKAN